MAKNTYFTHGTRNEQILNGNLVDEYLKMFGLDIVYIPRKLIKKDTILNDEVSQSLMMLIKCLVI